jgi:hypothetical protein
VEQVGIPVELCELHGKPFAFVLNHAAPSWKLTKSTADYLKSKGGPILGMPISFRQAYMSAAIVGKSAPEIEKDDGSKREIDALWEAVKRLLKANG